MNAKQATRPIRKGAHWMNSEREVVVTRVTSRNVNYNVIKPIEAVGFSEIWHFRETYSPGRLPKTCCPQCQANAKPGRASIIWKTCRKCLPSEN